MDTSKASTRGGGVSRYEAGRRAEYKARRILEAEGYYVTRAAGSKGCADLVAWNAARFRLISVKRGSGRLSPQERRELLSVPAPDGTTREYWRFPARGELAIEIL